MSSLINSVNSKFINNLPATTRAYSAAVTDNIIVANTIVQIQ